MRITILLFKMDMGGAQRVVSILANAWAMQGAKVTILLLEGERDCFYPLSPSVTLEALRLVPMDVPHLNAIGRRAKRWRLLRQALLASEPDVVLSIMTASGIWAVLSLLGTGKKVLICEHSYPGRFVTPAWTAARSLVYPLAAASVVLNERSRDYFGPIIRARCHVIPNPVIAPSEAVEPPLEDSAPRPALVSLGTLTHPKGFDHLIQVFSQLAPKNPDWSLIIYGEGPERARLETLIEQLGLQARVSLPGATRSPYQRLRQGDLFVLSSRYEGFPMVLCEAMACGLPVVSLDCVTGPREIIRPGVDGVLVPDGDLQALENALHRLMNDPEERARLARRAPEVMERFGLEAVLSLWERLFAELGVCGETELPSA